MAEDRGAMLRAKMVNIARLYGIVLGRMPDVVGLSDLLKTPDHRNFARDLAARLLGSEEFLNKVGLEDRRVYLCRSAFDEPPRAQTRELTLVELVLHLAARQEKLGRPDLHDVLAVCGVRADERGLYGWWLGQKPAATFDSIPVEGSTPLLSVIVERHQGADIAEFEASIASVAKQTGGRVELLAAIRGRFGEPALARLAKLENVLIRHVVIGHRRSETALLNKALKAARGAFFCVLTEGDRLDPSAVAQLSRVAGEVDIVLSDQDQIDVRTGEPHSPEMNGGWDPDAALSRPPRCLPMMRVATIRALRGFRGLAEGEHDWDLVLRAARRVGDARIRHVPEVLVHRARQVPGFRRGDAEVGRRIVRDHLDETRRRDCRLDGGGRNEPVRVVYPVPPSMPRASIIIPTRDQLGHLKRCLNGLLQHTLYPNFEVIIVDNESREEPTLDFLAGAGEDPRLCGRI